MKRVILALTLSGLLSACAGEMRPVSSECFSSAGRATCSFTPLPELHARGRVGV